MSSLFTRFRKGSLHMGRYGEILAVLIRYGFGDLIASLNIEKYTAITARLIPRRKKIAHAHHISRWERIRLSIEELGPTFIKFGQFMSNRPDILPRDLIIELEKLQDDVRPLDSAEATRRIEQQIKRPLNEVFATLDPEPVASASIAQVHKAVLIDGTEVAVKIRRPRMRQTIETDLEILHNLVGLFERHNEKIRPLHLLQLVEEFRSMLEKELDFTTEAANLERFRHNFRNNPTVYIPRSFPELTTPRMLVTEFIHGIKVSDVDKLRAAGLDTRSLARHGADLILKQIFEHGYFHADPHPGNILVRRDGTICFLDFGATGIIAPSLRYQLSIILYGIVHRDQHRIIRALSQLARHPIHNTEQLEYDLTEFIEQYAAVQLREVNVGEVLRRFLNIIINHQLRIVPGFYMLLKSLLTIESVGSRLDPTFNMTDQAEPFIRKLLREYPSLRLLPYEAYFTLLDIASLIKDMPWEVKEIIRILKSGEMRIQFEHRGLDPLLSKADQLINRVVFSMVLASLIIGSSVVVHSGIPPRINDIPLIGVAGFVLAGLIGFGLLFDILRHRRM